MGGGWGMMDWNIMRHELVINQGIALHWSGKSSKRAEDLHLNQEGRRMLKLVVLLLACLLHTSDVSTLFMVDKVTREQAGRLAGRPSAKAAGLSPKLGRSSSAWPTCVLGTFFWCPTFFHQNLFNYIGPRLLLWRMVKVCEQVVVGEPDGGSTHKSLIAWLGE